MRNRTVSLGFKSVFAAAAMAVTFSSSAALADNWSTGTSGRITSGSSTNIGIGTTTINSGIRLQINGNVRASGFIEATGGLRVKTWAMEVPDYVFADGYKLRSLAEIESFVKTNHHLPEVPSAAAMEKEGMDVAAMNLLLLKKVEELTLHVIAQDKQIKALQAKVDGSK